MNRRTFITLLAGAASWPLAAGAQQPGKVPTIGFLGAPTPTFGRLWLDAFVQRLREAGNPERTKNSGPARRIWIDKGAINTGA